MISKHCDPLPLHPMASNSFPRSPIPTAVLFRILKSEFRLLGEIVCRSILWKRRYRQDKNPKPWQARRTNLNLPARCAWQLNKMFVTSSRLDRTIREENNIITASHWSSRRWTLKNPTRGEGDILFPILCWGRGGVKDSVMRSKEDNWQTH